MAPPLPPALTHLLATRGEGAQEIPAQQPAEAELDAAADGQVRWSFVRDTSDVGNVWSSFLIEFRPGSPRSRL